MDTAERSQSGLHAAIDRRDVRETGDSAWSFMDKGVLKGVFVQRREPVLLELADSFSGA
jgi:hypothetical protein